MTFDEVRDWALSHGFETQPDGRLSAPCGDFRVEMEFKRRRVRVTQTRGDLSYLIVSGHPKNAHVNEYGVMEGLGLSASFLMRYPSGRDLPPPPWMSREYVDALGWEGAAPMPAPCPARSV